MRRIEDGHAGAGNPAAHEFGVRDRRRHVVAAGDDQRRAFDPGQQFALVERRQRLAAGDVALDRRGQHHRLHVGRDLRLALAKIRRQPARHHGVGDGGDAALLHRLDAIVPARGIRVVAGSVGQHDLAEPVGRVGP